MGHHDHGWCGVHEQWCSYTYWASLLGTWARTSTSPLQTKKCKDAFLPLAIGQVVTTISPPLFVWADARCLTGAWYVLATTYSEDEQSCIARVDITTAGIAPMAALFLVLVLALATALALVLVRVRVYLYLYFVRVDLHVCTCACVLIRAYVYLYVCTCTCTCVLVHVRLYVYVCTCAR